MQSFCYTSRYRVNIQHLRHSLKVSGFFTIGRIVRGWYDCEFGEPMMGSRPSSFILATLSNLEPQLTQCFHHCLSNDPDQIVAALGLNFNPDAELKLMTETNGVAETLMAMG